MQSAPGANSDAKQKGKCFLKLLKKKEMIAFLLFVHDVLMPMKYLSERFQRADAVLAEQYRALETAVTTMLVYKER